MEDLRLLLPLCAENNTFRLLSKYRSLKPDTLHLNFIINVDIVLGLLNWVAWAVLQKTGSALILNHHENSKALCS